MMEPTRGERSRNKTKRRRQIAPPPKREPLSALPRINSRLLENTFLDVMDVPRSTPLVLFLRCSTGKQSGTLMKRVAHLIAAVKAMGFTVVAVFKEIGNGAAANDEHDRPALHAARAMAKRVGGVVVAHSVCRFLRPDDYDPHAPTAARHEHVERFIVGSEVDHVCLWGPSTTDSELKQLEQVFDTRTSTGKRYTEKDRTELVTLIAWARRRGLTWQEIQTLYGVSKSQAWRWLRKVNEAP